MVSVGILGGTFNPPHRGHLALARQARREIGLERVLLMPVHAPHKPLAADPGPEHRLAMCKLLVQKEQGISACALEVRRGGVSYTADTLAAIHASHPRAELTFIVGADTARTLPSWHQPQTVLALASLAIAEREGSDRGEVTAVLDALRSTSTASGEAQRGAHFLSMSPIKASSSEVRRRIADGASIDDLTGTAVAAYITEYDLYDEAEETEI